MATYLYLDISTKVYLDSLLDDYPLDFQKLKERENFRRWLNGYFIFIPKLDSGSLQ